MTRQPAAEKRFTVAWPMPRLAPVSSSVRRGWLVCGAVAMAGHTLSSRIKPRLAPRRARPLAAELDAVVQPERPVLPELDAHWNDSKTRPVRRPRHACRSRTWRCRARSPSRRRAGFPAATIACWPRRRSATGASGWRNRRRPRHPRPARPGRAGAPGGSWTSSGTAARPWGCASNSRPFWLSMLV